MHILHIKLLPYLLGILALALFGIFFVSTRTATQPPILDELAGNWRGVGQYEDNAEWFVEYRFNGAGTYEMKTDSAYGEKGTYEIEHFEDGSIIVKKNFVIPNGEQKEYKMSVAFTEDRQTMSIEGMPLKKLSDESPSQK